MLKISDVPKPWDMPIRETARPVVKILGYSALAVDQAGVVICQDSYSMKEYYDEYSCRRMELLSEKAVQGTWGYQDTVYTTWEISLCTISTSFSSSFETADYRFRKLLIAHMDACLGIHSDWMSEICRNKEKECEIEHTQTVNNDENFDIVTRRDGCLDMANKFALAYHAAGRRPEALC